MERRTRAVRRAAPGMDEGAALELPFDQYQRYRLVADLLGSVRGPAARWRILDVGGRTGLLRLFLPRDEVVLVDVEPGDVAKGFVRADGAALPFADGSFDVVAAFDTLEHVPPSARKRFVAECRRVARRYAILAGPYAGARVERAEGLLAEWVKRSLGEPNPHLEEHRANGLPRRADVERWLADDDSTVVSVPHGNLEHWLAAMCVELYVDSDPALRAIAPALRRFYNENLWKSDATPPVYRHAIVAAYRGAKLPELPPAPAGGSAPKGAVHGFARVVAALSEFDRARGEWRAEREAFQRSVDTLVEERDALRAHAETLARDLDGHRAVVAQRERDAEALRGENTAILAERDALRSAVEVIERERDALREHAATLERDLEGHRAGLAERTREAAALREHADTLERDLDGHRGSLAEASREIAALRETDETRSRECAALREHARTIERDLDGHRGKVRDLETALAEAAATREAERARADEAEAKVTALEGEVALLARALTGAQQAIEALGRAELARRHDASDADRRAREANEALATRVAFEDGLRRGYRSEIASLTEERERLSRDLADLAESLGSAASSPDSDDSDLPASLVARVRRQQEEIDELRARLIELGAGEAALVRLDENEQPAHRAG